MDLIEILRVTAPILSAIGVLFSGLAAFLKVRQRKQNTSASISTNDSMIVFFGVIGGLLLLLSINILVWAEGKWQAKRYTTDLIQHVTKDTADYTSVIYECYPSFKSTGLKVTTNVISNDEALKIITMNEHKELLMATKGVLNYLEGLSSAYLNGVADKEMFETSFKNVIGLWYGRLQGFMAIAKQENGSTWEPFRILGERWMDLNAKPNPNSAAGQCFK